MNELKKIKKKIKTLLYCGLIFRKTSTQLRSPLIHLQFFIPPTSLHTLKFNPIPFYPINPLY